ncbi:hypothetical protein N7493_001967 [Penicillium malachiteum]|uniref:SnoaL-like domain-containing protein n=1 Tax=Penicillium malachiteum TaxID=1324776 RepID=A0AAD6N095_9EURO|nr:hypothetical protein N7493_001967 [Penicillium malachiteum]
MARPVHLPNLTTREAIQDAVYRCIIGFDRHDHEMFESSMTGEDAVFELKIGSGEPQITTGVTAMKEGVLKAVGPLDTLHVVSNFRTNYTEGANTASLTAYAQAQHCPPGRGAEPDGPKFMSGGEYRVDLVKDESDGLWKAWRFVVDIIWVQGDPSVMQSAHSE